MTRWTAEDSKKCVVCGTRTMHWVRGWDDLIRCVQHASEGPRPLDRALNEYLLVADEGHLEVTHEPCGERLLLTLRVHMDTLTRLARDHTCSTPKESS